MFANLTAALHAAGAAAANVIKLTYYLTDVSDLPQVIAARDEWMDASRPPASTVVEVAALYDPRVRVEVEARQRQQGVEIHASMCTVYRRDRFRSCAARGEQRFVTVLRSQLRRIGGDFANARQVGQRARLATDQGHRSPARSSAVAASLRAWRSRDRAVHGRDRGWRRAGHLRPSSDHLDSVIDQGLAAGARAFIGVSGGMGSSAATRRCASARWLPAFAKVAHGYSVANCLGVMDTHSEFTATAWFARPAERQRCRGRHAKRHGRTGLRRRPADAGWVSPGSCRLNQADVEISEILEGLVDHEPTRLVVVYCESFLSGRRVFAAAQSLVEAGKPF